MSDGRHIAPKHLPPDLRRAMKALRIFDECMQELSCYVGHTVGRTGEQAFKHAVAQCDKGMKAKKIMEKLEAKWGEP